MKRKTKYNYKDKAVYNISSYILFTVKYKRSILKDDIKKRTEELINGCCKEQDIKILMLDVQPNYIYMRISYHPALSVGEIVRMLKKSGNSIMAEFPEIKSKLPSLWSSYYMASDDAIIKEDIEDYMETQPTSQRNENDSKMIARYTPLTEEEKRHLLKTILTATVVATLLTATACGSKQTSDNTTVQQTTEAVKVVSNVDVKSEADKKESEKKEEADKEQTTEAGETTEETKEEAADNAEQNDEAVAGEVNETFEELKEAVNEPQNTAEAPVQEEQAAPAEQPAEAPAENNNAGAVDTTPEEQPAAPAEPSPAPSPAPAPVVTPQETAKPSVTEEQQLVATGKWTKMYDDIKADDGSIYTYYEYTCPITGYSIEADFKDGTFCRELVNSAEECRAVYNAHGITDTVCSFDRLMKLSNS